MSEITVTNDITYLFLQWLNMDYNFWNVIFADIILMVLFFGGIFLIGFIFMCLGWLK